MIYIICIPYSIYCRVYIYNMYTIYIYYILYTIYYILYTIYYILYTLNYILSIYIIIRYTLHITFTGSPETPTISMCE